MRLVQAAGIRLKENGIRGLTFATYHFIHGRLLDHFWRLKAAVSPPTTTVSFADLIVEFVTETPREQRRFETLMGERQVLESLIGEISADDVVWDVGGSWGMFTVPLAATGADVTAFEPVPDRVDKIERNLEANGLDATINRFALGNEQHELTLALSGENPGGLTERSGEEVATEVRVGDVVAADNQSPTVLKIDVEGAEVDVLEGLEETLYRNSCPLVVFKIHKDYLPDFGGKAHDVREILEGAGFRLQTLYTRNESNYHIIARKQML